MNRPMLTLTRPTKDDVLKVRLTSELKDRLTRVAIARETDLSTLIRDQARRLVLDHERAALNLAASA